MDKHTLQRTGQAPLTFQGKLLAEESGKWHTGQERNRWHDLAIYRTAAGKYVVAISYQTCWQGEHDWHGAEVLDSAAHVAAVFQDYRPEDRVQRLPEHYGKAREDQDRRIRVLVQDYQDRVTTVLGDEFAESVD